MAHINAPEPCHTRAMQEEDFAKCELPETICSVCLEIRGWDELEISFYEWYSPIVQCKQGKGCRRGDNQ